MCGLTAAISRWPSWAACCIPPPWRARPTGAQKLGDNTLVNRDPRTIVWVPVILVIPLHPARLGDFTQTYFMGYVGRRVVTRLRGEVFERVLQFPIRYFDRNSAAHVALPPHLQHRTDRLRDHRCRHVGRDHDPHYSRLDRVPPVLNADSPCWRSHRPPHGLADLRHQSALPPLTAAASRTRWATLPAISKESFEAPRLIKVYNARTTSAGSSTPSTRTTCAPTCASFSPVSLANPIVQLVTALGVAVVLYIAIGDAIAGRMTMGSLLGFFTALVGIAQPLRRTGRSRGQPAKRHRRRAKPVRAPR